MIDQHPDQYTYRFFLFMVKLETLFQLMGFGCVYIHNMLCRGFSFKYLYRAIRCMDFK